MIGEVIGEVIDSPRVVIADDHPPTRAVIRRALEHGGFRVVGEGSDAESAVALVHGTTPELALLDVRMPGGGITAAAAITTATSETAVVMLTVSEDDEDLFAALRAGALGYVLKGGPIEELPGLLRQALSGEAVLQGSLLARVLRQYRTAERRRLFERSARDSLTKREFEVLMLLEKGATTREIADELFISQVTVRSHVAAICRKLHVPREHFENKPSSRSSGAAGPV